MDDIIQATDLTLSHKGTDLSVIMKQIEYSIKNKYQIWQNKNKIPINRYIETLSKEIDLRLGQVSHNITTSLVKFSYEAPANNFAIANKDDGVSQLDERKQSVTLGVASVGVYAGLASAGIALAPVAMLIMPLGMYFIQKEKAAKMEALKTETIKILQIKGIEFKEEVLKNIIQTEKDFTNEIEKRVVGFADKIESQIEKTEQERKGMEADIQNKIEYLSNIRKKVLAL
jgi:gas vesicle protein